MKLRRRPWDRRNWVLLCLIFFGLLFTSAEYFTGKMGLPLCPYSGCRLAESSAFANFLGLNLLLWGLAYFTFSLFLLVVRIGWLFYWSLVGLGVSLYLFYIQGFVLGQFCLSCVIVEVLVFLQCVFSWYRRPLLYLLAPVLVSFLAVHAGYTVGIPLQYSLELNGRESLIQRYFTWGDSGHPEIEIEYFFDFDCPACRKSLDLLQSWSKKHRARLIFRVVNLQHNGKKAASFLSLIKRGYSPFRALQLVEEGKVVKCEQEKALNRLLGHNRMLLLSLGFDRVPVLLIRGKGCLRAYQGMERISMFLKEGESGFSFQFLFPSSEIGRSCGLEGCN